MQNCMSSQEKFTIEINTALSAELFIYPFFVLHSQAFFMQHVVF